MTKLQTRKGPAAITTPPSEWAAYRANRGPYNGDIALDPLTVVTIVDELAVRLQADIRPQTTWRLADNWVQRHLAFRWEYPSGQYELILSADELGFYTWLFPVWDRFGRQCKIEPLAYWPCHRQKGEIIYDTRGDLEVYRGEHTPSGEWQTTHLRYEHRLLEDVPRAKPFPYYEWRPAPILAELGADIIAVTSRHLALAAVA